MLINIIDFYQPFNSSYVILYGRDINNKSIKLTVNNYNPYFYIECNNDIIDKNEIVNIN